MSLEPEQIAKVALLARLRLEPAEIERVAGQLSQIVDYVALLEQLDTSEVVPLSHPLECLNVFRADEPRDSFPREVMLANAPKADGECYLVPPVLGE